jgi:isoleucyl-tRNA synthetase
VKDYGADVIRLWVASQDYRNDIVVSEERLKKVGESYRLIRNTLRYQLSNLYDFDPAKHAVAVDRLTGLDRWILGECARLEADVATGYEAYEFHGVYQRVSQFAAVELSAVYHDIVKDRLYSDPADSVRRRSTQTVLHHLAGRLARMLSPILVFTADEAWEHLPNTGLDSVHLSDWVLSTDSRTDAERELWVQLFGIRTMALPELERARQAKVLGKSLEARLTLTLNGAALEAARSAEGELAEILNVSQLAIESGETAAARVERASGSKCERCWHWELEVGSSSAHPTLCPRCVAAVSSIAG